MIEDDQEQAAETGEEGVPDGKTEGSVFKFVHGVLFGDTWAILPECAVPRGMRL